MLKNTKKAAALFLAAALLATSVPFIAADITISGTAKKSDGSNESGRDSVQEDSTKEEQESGDKGLEGVQERDGDREDTHAGDGDGTIEIDGEIQYGIPEEDGYDLSGITPNNVQPEEFDRYAYDPMANEPALMAVDAYQELTANISKRAEWTDKSNGNGKITLSYASNSGAYSGTEDLNVVLVQDKSGSMDPNYGFNSALVEKGLNIWGAPHWYYPIRNSVGYTEGADACVGNEYRKILNQSDAGMYPGSMESVQMTWNSPCQQEDHYYMMIKADGNSPSLYAGQMVHGNNLYNISSSDLHHYAKLSGGREEALPYLAAGRRVIKCADWVDSRGRVNLSEEYFLDISQVYELNGQQILKTCDSSCEGTDGSRLAKCQWFFDKLVSDIGRLNPNNKIAYVPFWGDVPANGSWNNASSGGSTTNIYDDNEGRMTYKEGVGYLGFTPSSNFSAVTDQINNPFTYAGTNWSRALDRTVSLLNGRSSEDKQKKTLVIFLTDGQPQGSAGKATDVENPYINGVGQTNTLKSIEGVTVYACGVGINLDNIDTTNRIDAVDSTGAGEFARQINEFDTLYANIINRLNSDFHVEITGNDTFYTDRLSGPFTLDEAKVDSSWKVLANPGSGTTKGVPTDVYNTVKNNPSVKKVYVRSTKTVYWHIGTMTDGGYGTSGHQCGFPIKYAGYQTSTGGKISSVQANTEQKLTYVSSTNTNKLLTVTLNTPSLVFNREDLPTITVNKALDGSSFTTDQTYRFAYCKTKQSGKVVSQVGTASVTVKAGQVSGSAIIKDVQPGTYYVYEVDASGNIISSQERTATVSMVPSITTLGKGNGIPDSATTTDGQDMANSNNYLHIVRQNASVSFTNHYITVNVQKIWDDSESARRPGSVTANLLRNGTKISSQTVTAGMGWKCSFKNLLKYDSKGGEYEYTVTEDPVKDYETKIEYTAADKSKSAKITNTLMVADLTVIKEIDADDSSIWWDHGTPTFMVKVSGKGLDGKNYTFFHTFAFTKEYVDANKKDGKVTMSYTFRDIPNSKDYRCEELCVSRWRLEGITGNGSNVSATEGTTGTGDEFFATHADANVKARPEGTEVTFRNVKDDYQWFSHITSVHNIIKQSE